MTQAPNFNRTCEQKPTANATQDLLAAYADISTSTLGHFVSQGYLAGIKPIHPTHQTQVGKVMTVRLHSANTQIIRQALIDAQAGDILCIDAQILGERACWGALRTCAAIYEQLAGVIVLGTVTDTAELRKLQFPVYAQGVSSLTTFQSDEKIGELNTDLTYCHQHYDTFIQSGDIAIMDDDGVFVLPFDIAQSYMTKCQNKQTSDDERLAEFIKRYM